MTFDPGAVKRRQRERGRLTTGNDPFARAEAEADLTVTLSAYRELEALFEHTQARLVGFNGQLADRIAELEALLGQCATISGWEDRDVRWAEATDAIQELRALYEARGVEIDELEAEVAALSRSANDVFKERAWKLEAENKRLRAVIEAMRGTKQATAQAARLAEALERAHEWAASYPLGGGMDEWAAHEVYEVAQRALADYQRTQQEEAGLD